MTLGEKYRAGPITGRPGSHVPARVVQRLTGLNEAPADSRGRPTGPCTTARAALLDVLRSIMAHAGLRGPVASAKFAVVRLTNDRIPENATGAVAARDGLGPGQRHAAIRTGRHADVGPLFRKNAHSR